MRLFARDWRTIEAAPDWETLRAADRDDDDDARARVLADLVTSPTISASVHPGVDPPDVLHVYLQSPHRHDRVFACVIVSEDRLREMLRESSTVLEGMSLQVAAGSQLTQEAIRAAIQTWSARNFGRLPRVSLLPWKDEHDDDATEPSGVRQLSFSLQADFEPSGSVAEPPWRDAL